MTTMWMIEESCRTDTHLYEVWSAPDGMKALYRRTHLQSDVMKQKRFTGEMSVQAAMRAFHEDVIPAIHSGGW